MFAARRSKSFRPRPVLMAAALLALVLQLMFPAGYMAAEPGRAHGFPIVICSAQGPITADWDAVAGQGTHDKAPSQKGPGQKGMAHCPFAGHALASDIPAPVAISVPVAFIRAAAPDRPYAVFPGRGLAAPPPPAIGPPSLV